MFSSKQWVSPNRASVLLKRVSVSSKQSPTLAKKDLCLHQTGPLFQPNRASIYCFILVVIFFTLLCLNPELCTVHSILYTAIYCKLCNVYCTVKVPVENIDFPSFFVYIGWKTRDHLFVVWFYIRRIPHTGDKY